jgi:tetratricopeptide (TPR) repeat protein
MTCGHSFRWHLPALALLLAALPAAAEDQPKHIYDQVLKAAAWILAEEGGRTATGTGWLVDKADRLLVTNYHVVNRNEEVKVVFPQFDGRKRVIPEKSHYRKKARAFRGQVIARDKQRDLALIQVASLPDQAEALLLAAESAGPGDRVHSVGNPGASDALWVYTSGTVRQVYRKRINYGDFTVEARIVETQSPINPGDSGGPVVNDAGELIGVTTGQSRKGQLVSYCIDVSEVRAFLGGEGQTATTKTAESLTRRGVEHAQRREYAAALRDFNEALKLDPKYAPAYSYRSAVFVNRDELERALKDADEAIKLNPKLASAWSNRGAALRHKKDYAAAVDSLNKAVEIHPKGFAALYNRGLAHYEMGQYDQAINDLTAFVKLRPKAPEGYQWRARAYAKKGDEAKAKEDQKKAAELKSSPKQ